MNLGFDNVVTPVSYVRSSGVHTNATLVSVKYDATESYEYFDIELDVDGAKFRERTFIPNADKVYPKKKYEKGVEVGEETKEEAFNRSISETITKLFYLGACFVDETELKTKVKAKDWKGLIDAFNKTISFGDPNTKLNFLTVWKNNDTKRTSNLIVPERTKWVEKAVEGQAPTLKLNKWQTENLLVEKYPYNGGTSSAPAGTEAISGSGVAADELPF